MTRLTPVPTLAGGAPSFGDLWASGGNLPDPGSAALVTDSGKTPVFILALLAGFVSSGLLDRPFRDGSD